MRLRVRLLLRACIAWMIGVTFALLPEVLPWRRNTLIPSAAVLQFGIMMALPILLVGGVCCLIWARSIGHAPARWIIGTMLASWVYLLLDGFDLTLPNIFAGAAVSAGIMFVWCRLRPLDSAATAP